MKVMLHEIAFDERSSSGDESHHLEAETFGDEASDATFQPRSVGRFVFVSPHIEPVVDDLESAPIST